ncbi:MAG: T9SS type A sorting domain-containing protein, partial [Candidatus Zixiibacteriota bacterium]
RALSGFSLRQNYPNPFNPGTRIEFVIPRNGWVTLEIYNVLGQRVRRLVADRLDPGLHSIAWDGKDDSAKDLADGIYFYRLQTEDFAKTKKMILLK